MPELGPSGSVRGAVSNHRSYRDREHPLNAWSQAVASHGAPRTPQQIG